MRDQNKFGGGFWFEVAAKVRAKKSTIDDLCTTKGYPIGIIRG